MRRRKFIALLGGAAAAWPLAARAQQLAPGRPLIGLLSPLSQAAAVYNVEAFRKGLRDLGYFEGHNIVLEFRFADGLPERLPQLAAELVALKSDIIFVGSTSEILAARAATQTIPLIMITIEDPVALGLVKSMARPGTNVTGTWLAGDEALVGKRLALLKDVVPGLVRLGAIINSGDMTDAPALRLLPSAARAMNLELLVIEVRAASEFDVAFAAAARDGVQALFMSQTPFFNTHRVDITARAVRAQLPAVYGFREFADVGGLMSYGPNLPDVYRRSAGTVDKILKGVSTAELPVHGEFVNPRRNGSAGAACEIPAWCYRPNRMMHLLILAVHFLTTIAKLVRPGGVRAVVAESLLLKHQLVISRRAR